MKTVLLVTNSVDTQRLLAEVLGPDVSPVLLTPPGEPSREKFDALWSPWLGMADALVLDAAALGESARWALEALAATRLQEYQAVVVRATAGQQTLYTLPADWLVVLDTDSAEQLRQTLTRFLQLREAQARLQRMDLVLARQRQVAGLPSAAARMAAGAPAATFDSYRYRDALKDLSLLVGQGYDEATLLREFCRLVRELFGIARLALLVRAAPGQRLSVAVSAGIRQEMVDQLSLSAEAGLGGRLAQTGRILSRDPLSDPLALEYDPQIAREFDLLGAEVAVPMFDSDRLSGVLAFSGKITGDALGNDELELVYHLLSQLAQALRNRHLLAQVENQQRLLSEVLANVQSGVVVIGEDRRVLSLNRRAQELLELGPQNVVGQDAGIIPSRVADVMFEALQLGREIPLREVVLPRNNRPLGVRVSRFTPSCPAGLTASTGAVAVALIEDLTQTKFEQARARELEDKEFFMRVAERLEHELKNAMTPINSFAQLLPELYGDKDFQERCKTMVPQAVNRVVVLLNNLAFFAHPLGLVYEELVLSELIETCLQNVTQEFTRKQLVHLVNAGDKPPETTRDVPVVTVKRNFGHKLPRLEGDRIRLMQAFENLLRNAVQAMPAGGRLLVSTADALPADCPEGKVPTGGAVCVEFQDNGEGIPLGSLKRVTEPFVTTRNVAVGLGLTIVKRIVERHSGRLEIDSMLGRGTTVSLVIPVKMQPHPEDQLLAQVANGADAAPATEVEGAPPSRLAPAVDPHPQRHGEP